MDREARGGLPRLSPLMGALYLDLLDRRMAAAGLCCVRFMDDWGVLAPTRWKLRRAVRRVNRTLAELKVAQHPDKTFVGSVERGFDFLGYRMAPGALGVAQPARDQFVVRVHRLYEQGAAADRIGEYVRRWWRWGFSGLRGVERQLISDATETHPRPAPIPSPTS